MAQSISLTMPLRLHHSQLKTVDVKLSNREDFVDGILKNKFPSSRLEMNAVADKFDHGDGMIDWREFMAALRPDWQDRGPLTDSERIDDEINRQVALCTCKQKFKVFQVGEGKYRVSISPIVSK